MLSTPTGRAVAAAGLLALVPAARAANDASIAVVARVLPRASAQVLSLPAGLQVTRADVERGFVDAPAPARLVIRDNTGGFVLSFETTGGLARRVHIAGLGSPVELTAPGGNVMHTTSARGVAVTTLELSFRFDLDPGTPPGAYAFPVQMTIVPL